jgi:hypothetical protein
MVVACMVVIPSCIRRGIPYSRYWSFGGVGAMFLFFTDFAFACNGLGPVCAGWASWLQVAAGQDGCSSTAQHSTAQHKVEPQPHTPVPHITNHD